jgi:hypothetical protein
MNDTQVFRLVLVLPMPEAEALARLAKDQLRPMREQAHYLLRASLIAERVLPEPTPKPSTEGRPQ